MGPPYVDIFQESFLLATLHSLPLVESTGLEEPPVGRPTVNYTQINPHTSRRSTVIHLAQVICHTLLDVPSPKQ